MRIVHRVQMNPVNVAYKQIDNLTERIRHSRIKKRRPIIFISVDDFLKTRRERRPAHRNHPLYLRRINHRHDSRNQRCINLRNSAVFHKPEEMTVIEEKL